MVTEANFVTPTNDGGYVVVGRFAYEFPRSNDLSIIKTNQTGLIQWVKLFNETERDEAFSSLISADGNIVVAGRKGGVLTDVWLIKITNEGKIVWKKTYPDGNDVHDMIQLVDHSIILCGTSISEEGYSNGWILKIDANGKIIWEGDNTIVLGGNKISKSGTESDAWLLKVKPK